jgi:hypothetical protein
MYATKSLILPTACFEFANQNASPWNLESLAQVRVGKNVGGNKMKDEG